LPSSHGTHGTHRTHESHKPAAKGPKLSAHTLPASGADLLRRLSDYDGRLAAQGLCRPGDLIKHVVQAGVKAGHSADLTAWTGAAIQLAVEQTRTFEASRRPQPADRKEVA
jgi:hypothetical protein